MQDVPNWTPLLRSADTDTNEYRVSYLGSLKSSSSQGWLEWLGSSISRIIFLK